MGVPVMERRTTRRPFRQAGLPVLGSCCLLVHRRFLVITENSLGVMVARLMPTESPKARLEIKMVRRQASSFKRLFVLSSCECVERRRGDAFSPFHRFAASPYRSQRAPSSLVHCGRGKTGGRL